MLYSNLDPDVAAYCLTLTVFLKESFEKVDFGGKQQVTKIINAESVSLFPVL